MFHVRKRFFGEDVVKNHAKSAMAYHGLLAGAAGAACAAGAAAAAAAARACIWIAALLAARLAATGCGRGRW